MAALEFELGPLTLAAVRALTDALNRFPGMAAEPARAPVVTDGGPEEWLSATDFCKKYDIGRTTLQKRVEQGIVEKRNCGGRTPRYRWVKGHGDRV